MTKRRKYVQGRDYQLFGSGVSLSATTIILTSMTLPNSGDTLSMADFGELGYATLEPDNNAKQETISFTGITVNANLTVSLTGVTRGILGINPYTVDNDLRQSHAGGTIVRISNQAVFYSEFANKKNDEVVEGQYQFPSDAGSLRPTIATDTNAVLATELVTKGEMNRAIAATYLTPVVVNTSSATTGTSQAASLTWAHVSSGTDRLLVVEVSTQQDQTITGITYNGDALTQAVAGTRVTGNIRSEIWYRIAPDLGTNNIVVTMSAAAYISAAALTLNSAAQTTPIGITGTANGSSTAPSVAVVTTQDNSLVIDSVATANDPIVFTAGANQSIQQSISSAATRQIATSVEATTTAGSTTMSYTISPTTNWAIAAIEVKGITGGGGGGSDAFTVKATAADTTPSQLDNKIEIVSADGSVSITKTIQNPAGNEKISYDLSAIAGGSGGTKLLIDTTQVVTANDNVENTIYTGMIPGGTLGTNDAIRFKILFSVLGLGNSPDEDKTFRVKYGGTTIATLTPGIGTTATTLAFDGASLEGVIVAAGATNAQKGFAHIDLGQTAGETTGETNRVNNDYGTAAVDSTINQNLVITVQSNQSSGVTAQALVVEKISSGTAGLIINVEAGEDISEGDTVGYSTLVEDEIMKAVWAYRFQDTGVVIEGAGGDIGGQIFSICEIATDKYAVLYRDRDTSAGQSSIVVLSLDRGTMQFTAGAPANNVVAGTSGAHMLVQVDTDKFALVFHDTGSAQLKVWGASVSGVTITMDGGGEVVVFTGGSNFGQLDAVQLATDSIAIVGTLAVDQPRLVAVAFSGSTPSFVDDQDLSVLDAGGDDGKLSIEKIAANKVVILQRSKVVACSLSGTWTMGALTTLTPSTGLAAVCGGLASVADDTFYAMIQSGNTVDASYCTVSTLAITQVTTGNLDSNSPLAAIFKDATNVYMYTQSAALTPGIYRLATSLALTPIVTSMDMGFDSSDYNLSFSIFQHTWASGATVVGAWGGQSGGGTLEVTYHVQGMTTGFVGIAQSTVTEGNNVDVKIGGVDDNQSGLTTGGFYEPFEGGLTQVTTPGTYGLVAQSATDIKI